MTTEVHERDIVATDEMIRNLKAGTFKKIAIGAGACGGLLLVRCLAAGLDVEARQRPGGAEGGAPAHAAADGQRQA